MTDDDRISYLMGEEPASALEASDRVGLDELRDLLADPALWVDPPAELEERVVAEVAAASRLDGVGAPRSTESSQPEGAGVQGAGRRAGGRRRLALVIGGLAAAVAIVIGVAVAVAGGGKQPLTYHAALGGTQLAPDAHGDVTLTQTQSGWRVALHASGLPRLDNGQFYQAWLKDRAGVLVPIGTFNQPADVTLWSGVPPYEYPMFTVTRQRAGQLASSGQRVLTGSAQKGG